MTITEPQARALAELLHQLRPEWVTTSILTLLWKHRDEHTFPELCTAAVTVANDTTKGPGIIFMDGPHWHPQRPQTPAAQQFLTAAEKSRLQAAQRAGYLSAKSGINPFDTSQAFYQPLITPDDLNPAATLEAFHRGQKIAQWEMRQRTPQPAAIETNHPDTLEEAQP